MPNHLHASIALALLLAASAHADEPAVKPSRLRGEIVAVDDTSMRVHRKGGPPGDIVDIVLKPDLTVAAVRNVRLQDIKAGSFVGATSVPDATGRFVASEIHVFPESARGAGEGHYDWDLEPRSTMTNANVDLVVDSQTGRDLHLSYKGGTKTIVVPEGTPVVTGAPATRADLIVGKKVFLSTLPDDRNRRTALRVVVEKDGVAPPF